MGSLGLTTLAMLALASSCFSQICDVPTANISEGCMQCFTYTIMTVKTNQVMVTITAPTMDTCIETLGSLYNALQGVLSDADIFSYFCTGLAPVRTVTYKTKEVCQVNPNPFLSNCIDKDDKVFRLQTPHKPGSTEYPASIVCFWNTPSLEMSEEVYVDTLKMDIQGNPSTKCNDKLVTTPGLFNTKQVSCGDADRPVFYNKITDGKLDPIFISDGSIEASGVELLLVYLNSLQNTISRGTNSGRDVSVDLKARPTPRSTLEGVCKCKEVNITELCSPISLENNVYYQKYLAIENSLPLNGEYGFSGYKGCPGIDFFGCDGLATEATDLECSTFTLGMTPAEADLFLVNGASMWAVVSGAQQDSFVCKDYVSSTVPNALEHIQIQNLALSQDVAKATACCNSPNPVLKQVAEQVKNEGIPVMC